MWKCARNKGAYIASCFKSGVKIFNHEPECLCLTIMCLLSWKENVIACQRNREDHIIANNQISNNAVQFGQYKALQKANQTKSFLVG